MPNGLKAGIGPGAASITELPIAWPKHSFVRDSLPPLGKYGSAFEEVRLRTFKKGDQVYRSPGTGENALQPNRWFGTRETVTKAGTESSYFVKKFGNPLDNFRSYEFKQDVTVYYGKVKNGTGYQLYIPKDLDVNEILSFKGEVQLKR